MVYSCLFQRMAGRIEGHSLRQAIPRSMCSPARDVEILKAIYLHLPLELYIQQSPVTLYLPPERVPKSTPLHKTTQQETSPPRLHKQLHQAIRPTPIPFRNHVYLHGRPLQLSA
jgi:hypothetical protein